MSVKMLFIKNTNKMPQDTIENSILKDLKKSSKILKTF